MAPKLYRGMEVTAVRQESTLDARADRFHAFCAGVEPRLRRGLVAAYGPDLGSEAATEALAWAWEHFERVEAMDNAVGYLWRVGQSSVRGATNGADVWAIGGAGAGERATAEAVRALAEALLPRLYCTVGQRPLATGHGAPDGPVRSGS